MNLDRRLLKQAKTAGAVLLLTIFLGIAGGGLVLLQARLLSHAITLVFLNGQSLLQTASILVMMLGAMLLRAVVVLLSEVSANAVSVRVKNNLREMLFHKLVAIGPGAIQSEQSGELTTTMVQGVEALDAYFSQYLPQIILAGVVPVLILAVVFPLDLLSGVVLVLTAPLIPVFMVLIGNAAEALTHRQYTSLSRMSAFFLDTLQGLTTLKTLGQSKLQAGRIAAISDRYRVATMQVLRVTFLSALVLELVGTLSTAIIAVEIGLRLLYGRIGFEQAFFILVIAPEFYLPLRLLGQRFHAGMAGISAARRIFEVLERPAQPEEMTSLRIGKNLSALPENYILSFEDVSLTYQARQVEAVAGIRFEIRSGQQVALVGPSGSGKSTLAALLLRFISPESGCIRFNGVALEEIPIEQWRSWIAWVPQQPYLFNDTLAANLLFARPDAGKADLDRVLSLVGLGEMLSALPKGYDTVLGEQGARLSGGQAQRLALARAFLKDAPILIFDEPTAHLDVLNETLLQAALADLCRERTVVTIAHRIPTVIRSDLIVVMDSGRVVERGTHDHLIKQAGLYSRLVGAYSEAG